MWEIDRLGLCSFFVEEPSKAHKNLSNLFRPPRSATASAMELWYLRCKQRRELFLVEFFDADLHVVRQHEVEEDLLLAVEVRADVDLGLGGPLLAGERRQRIGDVGQHVEQVAFLGVDDLLHLGQLVAAEALLGQALQELRCACRARSRGRAVRLRP